MNEERKNQQASEEPSLSEILQVRRDKLKALQDAGRDPFVQTRFERSAYSADIKNDFDAYDGKTLQAAGRIMSKRGMGKAIFCDIQDDRGQIQLYVRKDAVTEQEFADFRKYDIGDIIGVRGYAFKTKTGEISIHVQQVTLLSKSLRPLPEKFHGMTNTELRYRQRYVDLIMNPEVKQSFVLRSKFVKHVRDFMDERGYIEVETPVLLFQSGRDIWVLNKPQNHFVQLVKDGGGEANIVRFPESRHEIFSMPNSTYKPYLEKILGFYDDPMIACAAY